MDPNAGSDAPGQRMLAAIVFTDAVGFSARVGQNEERTLDLIRHDLDVMSEVCGKFEGQVVKNSGDGLMMLFTSAVQAVSCALEIQRILAEQAKSKSDHLLHRIGVHLGDVLVMKGDALGDGVNVAARLEQESEPGGICMSQTVYDVVKNRLFLQAAKIGDLRLKNIAEPVAAYKIAGVGKARKHVKVYRLNWALVAVLAFVLVAVAAATTYIISRNSRRGQSGRGRERANQGCGNRSADAERPSGSG